MATMDRPASVPLVDNQSAGGRGADAKARRLRFGWDKKHLAERAGISRDTLDRVEGDEPGTRPATYAKVERALDELAEELGFDEAEQGGRLLRVEVRTRIPNAEAIIFTAPVDDTEALERSVANILRQLGEAAEPTHPGGLEDESDTKS